MSVYLDHAATTPLRAEAREAWLQASTLTGNASSVHQAGQSAKRLVEQSREQLADLLGCEPVEVVFTSGGTESINTAVAGLWQSRKPETSEIVLPAGEHAASLDSVQALVNGRGASARIVPLDSYGQIIADSFGAALRQGPVAFATALVANNEVGTVNDAAALSVLAAEASVPLHLDAVAAWGQLALSFSKTRGDAPAGSGLCAMSVSGHKIGAPVGTGILVVARTAQVSPLLHGGASQRDVRSGTLDVAGIAALAAAAKASERDRESEVLRLRELQQELIGSVMAAVPTAQLMGHPDSRLPGNVHFLFPNAPGESMLFLLDAAGIAVSIGAACQAGVSEPSHVMLAMGHSEHAARCVLRMTLGHPTTRADITALASAIGSAYYKASGAGRRGTF